LRFFFISGFVKSLSLHSKNTLREIDKTSAPLDSLHQFIWPQTVYNLLYILANMSAWCAPQMITESLTLSTWIRQVIMYVYMCDDDPPWWCLGPVWRGSRRLQVWHCSAIVAKPAEPPKPSSDSSSSFRVVLITSRSRFSLLQCHTGTYRAAYVEPEPLGPQPNAPLLVGRLGLPSALSTAFKCCLLVLLRFFYFQCIYRCVRI
jgi:hypothetical protein